MPDAEVSGPAARGSPDAWSNRHAFHNLGDSSPFDVLAFTERRLLEEHWDRRHSNDKNIPRTYWERIQSCEPLKTLCAPYPSKQFSVFTGYPPGDLDAVERLHAVMELLEWFHRRQADFESSIRRKMKEQTAEGPDGEAVPGQEDRPKAPQPTRKQERRYWKAKLTGLKRATSLLEDMPDLLLTAQERDQLSALLVPAKEKAAQFAKNPPRPESRVVFLQIGPDGTETPLEVVSPANLVPDPLKRGQFRNTGSAKFAFNLETALVDELLLPMTKRKRRWKLLLDLLRHFNAKNFTPLSPHAIRERVRSFTEEHPESLQDHKQRYLARARHLIGTRPA